MSSYAVDPGTVIGRRVDAGPFVTLAHVEGGSVAWTVPTAGDQPGPHTDHLAQLERRAARREARRRAALAARRWVRRCFQRPARRRASGRTNAPQGTRASVL